MQRAYVKLWIIFYKNHISTFGRTYLNVFNASRKNFLYKLWLFSSLNQIKTIHINDTCISPQSMYKGQKQTFGAGFNENCPYPNKKNVLHVTICVKNINPHTERIPLSYKKDCTVLIILTSHYKHTWPRSIYITSDERWQRTIPRVVISVVVVIAETKIKTCHIWHPFLLKLFSRYKRRTYNRR